MPIHNIKKYLLDPVDVADVELGYMKKDLNVQKMISGYLRLLQTLGLQHLKADKIRFKELVYFEDFKEDNVRYCLTSSKSQEGFMRECFIQAGIINRNGPEYRLTFTSKSESAAYSCLAWDRSESHISAGEAYMVCDIGHSAISISTIQAASTNSTSTVKLLNEYPKAGSKILNDGFKSLLERRSLLEKKRGSHQSVFHKLDGSTIRAHGRIRKEL